MDSFFICFLLCMLCFLHVSFHLEFTPTLPEILSLGDAYLDKRWMGPEGIYLYSRYLDDLRDKGCVSKLHMSRATPLKCVFLVIYWCVALGGAVVHSMPGRRRGKVSQWTLSGCGHVIWIYGLPEGVALQDRGKAIFSFPFV